MLFLKISGVFVVLMTVGTAAGSQKDSSPRAADGQKTRLSVDQIPAFNQGSTGAVNRTYTARLQDTTSVKDFGATGDGNTDDTAALQLAINDSTGELLIPVGTYIISPLNGTFLTLKPNLHLRGVPGAVLKVKNNAGPYSSVLYTTDCTNCIIENLTIDSNISNNPISSLAEIAANGRVEILLFGGSNIRVRGITVQNTSALNSIVLNGVSVKNSSITDCVIQAVGDDPNHVPHDASAIYVSTAPQSNIVIAGNRIMANMTATTITDASIAGGSNTLTSAGQASWQTTDIGKSITVTGAGAGGGGDTTLYARITAVNSPTSALLDSSALTTVSNATASYISYAGNIAATTAIETHGSPETILGNTIVGFAKGLNITGISNDSDVLSVSGNNIDVLGQGIDWWTQSYGSHVNYGFNGLVINGNTIRIRQMQYAAVTNAVTGITCDAASNIASRNVNIADNIVVFDRESSMRTGNSYSVGLGCATSVAVPLDNVSISNNTIDNAPVAGIRLFGTLTGVRVQGNVIRDAGTSMDGSVAPGYKIPILILSPAALRHIDVGNNSIIDDLASSVMTYAYIVSGGGPGQDVRFTDDTVSLLGTNTSSFAGYFDLLDSNTQPLIRMSVAAKPWIIPANNVAAGSRVFDQTQGISYQTFTNGQTWLTQAPVALRTVSANYTAAASDQYIRCNAAAGNVTISLPQASASNGQTIRVMKVDSSANSCIVSSQGSDVINSGTSLSWTGQWAIKTFVASGPDNIWMQY